MSKLNTGDFKKVGGFRGHSNVRAMMAQWWKSLPLKRFAPSPAQAGGPSRPAWGGLSAIPGFRGNYARFSSTIMLTAVVYISEMFLSMAWNTYENKYFDNYWSAILWIVYTSFTIYTTDFQHIMFSELKHTSAFSCVSCFNIIS